MEMPEMPTLSPWINAAGTLGFAPPARSGENAWMIEQPLGAFVTQPISLAARSPAAGRAALTYPSGFLLHTGHPNPGLRGTLRRYADRWARAAVPVWVHLIPSTPAEAAQMVRQLEGIEGVQAVELGLPPEVRGDEALAFVQAAYGELPLALALPVTLVTEPWVARLPASGISAVTISPPRGMLIDAAGRPVTGRLYGPGLFPLTLAAVHSLRRVGVPVIAGVGIDRVEDAHILLDAGAQAVQLDTVLWRGWSRDPYAL